MRRRIPELFAAATTKIIKALGVTEARKIANRSESLIYKWAEQQFEHYPNLKQAVELDIAFVQNGGEAPPFLTAYMALVQQGIQSGIEDYRPLLANARELVNHACEILNAVVNLLDEKQDQPNRPLARLKCDICVNSRKMSASNAALLWRITGSSSDAVCPLQNSSAIATRCALIELIETSKQ